MSTFLLASASTVVTFILGVATHWLSTRRTLALQYDADLRADRLRVYADLWSRLEALNKYGRSSTELSVVDAEKLIADLKRWYFEVGGLYLSVPTRSDYFAVQNALQHAVATASAERDVRREVRGAEFEFLRVLASRLRTGLTRDVGTRKSLKLRGDPTPAPLPSQFGTYRRAGGPAAIELSARRPLRIAGRRLRGPVGVRGPLHETHASWGPLEWDDDALAMTTLRVEDGRAARRQILLEEELLVEGPVGWDPRAEHDQAPSVIWSKEREEEAHEGEA